MIDHKKPKSIKSISGINRFYSKDHTIFDTSRHIKHREIWCISDLKNDLFYFTAKHGLIIKRYIVYTPFGYLTLFDREIENTTIKDLKKKE